MIGSAYLESRILSADPVELVAILYEHAILYTAQARECLAKGDIIGRTEKIGRVISILGELDGSLNHSAGGHISSNLARLYQYMRERLLTANLKKQDQPLAEIEKLLTTLAEGWDGVAKGRHDAEQRTAPAAESALWETGDWLTESIASSQAWTA
jgi:flagellar protein FliS